jgi:DNA processing protein
MGQRALSFASSQSPARSISPVVELGAYETLWLQPGASFKKIADKFRAQPDALPSDLVDAEEALGAGERVLSILKDAGIGRFGVRVHRAGDYPMKLRDAMHPVELLYFLGFWDLVDTNCVAVVGTRQPSEEGSRRARKLVRELVKADWTIVSGLAAGIDTEAHTTALQHAGRTIAVIGTPINQVYPKQNQVLQARIARDMLVVSQIPILRYAGDSLKVKRTYFPERNITMSALTQATIIVEAGETSGTLTQARAALHQNRKLFILDSCFRNPKLTWPEHFRARGAIRVTDFSQILESLGAPSQQD